MTPLPRWLGVVLLLLISISFGSNHIAARVAFDRGASVATAVVFRSAGTALALFVLLLALRVPLTVRALTLRRALVIGALLALQSYCIYSSVARLSVALALLTFNTYPMMYILAAWTIGREPRPPRRALIAIPVALAGLALALDVGGTMATLSRRWTEIGVGVAFALTASLSFTAVLFLTGRWMAGIDARLRSCLNLANCGAIALVAATATGALELPSDGTGWLGLALLTLFYGASFTGLFALQPRMRSPSDLVVLNFEPVAVLFLGWAVLGQGLAVRQVAGALIVIGCIVAMSIRR